MGPGERGKEGDRVEIDRLLREPPPTRPFFSHAVEVAKRNPCGHLSRTLCDISLPLGDRNEARLALHAKREGISRKTWRPRRERNRDKKARRHGKKTALDHLDVVRPYLIFFFNRPASPPPPSTSPSSSKGGPASSSPPRPPPRPSPSAASPAPGPRALSPLPPSSAGTPGSATPRSAAPRSSSPPSASRRWPPAAGTRTSRSRRPGASVAST